MELIISLIAGALGGNAAGGMMKNLSLSDTVPYKMCQYGNIAMKFTIYFQIFNDLFSINL